MLDGRTVVFKISELFIAIALPASVLLFLFA